MPWFALLTSINKPARVAAILNGNGAWSKRRPEMTAKGHNGMRPPTPALAAITVFWVIYAIIAAYVLYQVTPPVNRVLLIILGGYAAVLALVTGVLLRRSRPALPDRDRKA